MEKITELTLCIDVEGEYKEFPFLSYAYVLDNSILCSLNIGHWSSNNIHAIIDCWEAKQRSVVFKNISSRTTALAVVKQKCTEELPQSNIVYSENFKSWFIGLSDSNIEKVIEKLNFVASKQFKGGRENLIEGIRNSPLENLKEIIIGNAVGSSYAAIRVLFVDFQGIIYCLNGFIKQNVKNEEQFYLDESRKCQVIFKELTIN